MHLVNIVVSANTKGAEEFAQSILTLAEKGKLQTYQLAPISSEGWSSGHRINSFLADANTAIKKKTATLIEATKDALAETQIKSPNLETDEFQDPPPNQATRLSSIGLFKEKSLTQPKADDAIISHNSSNFTYEQRIKIRKLIEKLEKERQSYWPYPNKDRKEYKVRGLEALLSKAKTLDVCDAVDEVEKEFPEIRKGSISTRTADLLDDLRNNKICPKIL